MAYVAYCKTLIDTLLIRSSEVQRLVDAAQRVGHYAILYPGFLPQNIPSLGYVLVLVKSADGALPRLRLVVTAQPGALQPYSPPHSPLAVADTASSN